MTAPAAERPAHELALFGFRSSNKPLLARTSQSITRDTAEADLSDGDDSGAAQPLNAWQERRLSIAWAVRRRELEAHFELVAQATASSGTVQPPPPLHNIPWDDLAFSSEYKIYDPRRLNVML